MKARVIIPTLLTMACLLPVGWNAKAETQVEGVRVLVVPFSALNVPDSHQWISRGIQENLVADFGRAGGTFDPITFQGQLIVEDNATAARLARQASATLAVRGAAQMVGANIRLTAQLIDAKTGDTVNTASVTGPTSDLLKLEDELSAQLRGVSVGNVNPTGPAGAGAPPAAPPGQPAPPQIIVIAQPSEPSYTYPPDYYSPAYNYAYPWGFGGFVAPIYISTFPHRYYCFPTYHITHTFTPGTNGPLTPSSPPGGIVPTSSFGAIQFRPGTPNFPQTGYSQPAFAAGVGGMHGAFAGASSGGRMGR